MTFEIQNFAWNDGNPEVVAKHPEVVKTKSSSLYDAMQNISRKIWMNISKKANTNKLLSFPFLFVGIFFVRKLIKHYAKESVGRGIPTEQP